MNRNKTALILVTAGILLSISSAALAKSNEKGSDILRDSSVAVLSSGITLLKTGESNSLEELK